MPHWLDKLLNRKPSPEPVAITREEADLEAFFTDFEHLRDVFSQLVTAPTLPKRLLVIHGVGGAGKSTLLRMFRLYCKRQHVPVAFVSGDEAKSPADVLDRFVKDLNQANLRLLDLERTLKQYRAIQAKVEREGAKLDQVARTGAKVAVEVAAGYVPVVGPVVAAFGGAGAEAFVDWLRSFLPKSELDLYLDPAQRLTEDFIGDLAAIAEENRVVLMFDTYEQMTGLDDWVRNLVHELPTNVLTVIAGRATLGRAWDRDWPGWMAHARIEALEAMDEETMRTLVRRYYATMRGGEPNPDQVEEIVQFARGLPLVITSAVRLWVRYGVSDFRAIKPQVVADLVDRLMEGTPEEMRPALEAAATLRWFNKDLLRELLPAGKVEKVYDDLRRFPFVRSRAEGLALHEVVREMLDENLRTHDPETYRKLHERAAAYFAQQLEQATWEERVRPSLEQLYHDICLDESTGIQVFQEMAEELTRHRLADRLRSVMNDVKTYHLVHKNSQLWQEYYNARLLHISGQPWRDVAQMYREISENQQAEPKLRAYALCDWGITLKMEQDVEKAAQVLQTIPSTGVQLDSKLASHLFELGDSYRRQGMWQLAVTALEQAYEYYEKNNDLHGLILTYCRMRTLYLDQGEWERALAAQREALQAMDALSEQSIVKAEVLGGWGAGWTWMGLYADTERNLKRTASIISQTEGQDNPGLLRDLGLVLGLQGKIYESMECFRRSMKASRKRNDVGGTGITHAFQGLVLLRCGKIQQAGENLARGARGVFEAWLPAVSIWRGILYEIKHEWETASQCYREGLEDIQSGRRYWNTAALTGLVRITHTLVDYDKLLSLLVSADQLAQQYEYNDHLASLRLTQGHIAWDGHLDDWGTGFDAALAQYQQALIYALRYNRFLLDEVLWGGDICTPLDPIIPHCLERGAEGRQMLIALRDWWQTGRNDVGQPRPDTISPIPEGIPLLEAEQIARRREPGDGSPQQTVVEKIDRALTAE